MLSLNELQFKEEIRSVIPIKISITPPNTLFLEVNCQTIWPAKLRATYVCQTGAISRGTANARCLLIILQPFRPKYIPVSTRWYTYKY